MTWQEREITRFESGEYKRIPAKACIGLDFPGDHYPHLAIKSDDPTMIAYTVCEAHGEADRQTSLKYGRYLKKVFPDMSDSDVQSYVVALREARETGVNGDAYTLHFTTERKTITEIFETEMSVCDSTAISCMHGKFAHWQDAPYHVYSDSPDVALAYVEHDGAIVARSVVSTTNKYYIRLYAISGSETLCSQLKRLLESAGYSKGSLNGSRLTRLDRRHGEEVLPYLDGGCTEVSEQGRYWIVTSDGDYDCCNTDGTGESQEEHCESCGNPQDECECIYCECCEESYPDGCEDCNMCERCSRCVGHERCRCERCQHCNNLTRDCECDICSDCSELTDNCECVRCSECDELKENCECVKCETCSHILAECDCRDLLILTLPFPETIPDESEVNL